MATGVTDFIKISEVRNEIDATFPNPGEDVRRDIEVKNNGYGHRLIGNAFEFLCKLLLYRRCNEVVRPQYRALRTWSQDENTESWEGLGNSEKCRWKAGETPPTRVRKFDGMQWEDREGISNRTEWKEMNEARPVWRRRQSAIKWTIDEDLSKLAHQYVQTGMNTKGVVKSALINAGWKPNETVHSWIDRNAFEEDVLDEMNDLFSLLREKEWTCGETVFEKPSFGNYLHILRGEGDFIVDDLLIDIKTTKNPTFTKAFWRQLLMYYVVNDVQRLIHESEWRSSKEPFEGKYPEINRVGIYFARFGELKTINMSDVINDRNQYEEFRAWIVDRALEENAHAQVDYSDLRSLLTEPYDYKRQRTLFDFE
ncbi:hypothetical protein SAMN04488063_1125 [Halopelagius inordinatus]|uniref:Uncharacterized protein n=1 Tax=Halopelagius inordinatus TaxID=553467 RepID=A0A1I2NCA1_9EURY|nr:hypothetical protein [Halopelagius inordinatus]SFG01213.1 hypothetical protein SAMN04488063_1125 [Halopelagius inordinatus]